jgi:hypothetical protein
MNTLIDPTPLGIGCVQRPHWSRLVKTFATCLAWLLAVTAAPGVSAQHSIADLGLTLSLDFEGFDGSAAPAGWSVTSSIYGGYSTGSTVSGGVYSYGTDATGAVLDRWLGFQFAGSPNDAVSFSAAFQNNTGTLISELQLSYQAYQFRAVQNGRSSFFNVAINDGAAIAGLGFVADNSLTTGQKGTLLGDTAFPVTLTATVSGLAIAPGGIFTIQWIGGRGSDTTGSSQGIGINNIQVTPIPEPSTWALAVGWVALMAAGCFRRRFNRQ